MASQDVEIRIKAALDTLDTAKGVSDLKSSLRELKGLGLEIGDSNQEAFNRIRNAIGQTNDKIADFNAAIKSSSGEPIENVTNAFRGMRGSLVSLDLGSFKQQFKILGENLNNLTGGVFNGFNAFKNYKTALLETGSASKAMKVATMELSAAVAATGIGALVVLLGVLIGNFDKAKTAGGFFGDTMRAIGSAIDNAKESLIFFSDALKLTNIGDQQRQKDLQAQYNKTEQAITRFYEKEIALAEASGESTENLYKNRDMLLKQQIQKEFDAIDARAKLQGEYNDEDKKEYERLAQLKYDIDTNAEIRAAKAKKQARDEEQKQKDKDKKDADEKAQKDSDNLKRKRAEEEKAAKDRAVLLYQQTLEDEKRFSDESSLRQKFNLDVAKFDEDFAKVSASMRNATYEQILTELSNQYEKEAKLKEDNDKKSNERSIQIAQQNFELLAGERAIDYQNQINDLDANYEKMRMSDFDYYQKRAELEKNLTQATKDEAEKRKQIEKDVFNAQIDIASNYVNAVGSLTELVTTIRTAAAGKDTQAQERAARQQFNILKGVQIAATIISGIAGVQNALSATTTIPEPFGTALKISNAIAVGVAAAANVAKIAATQFQGGGGPGPGPGPGPPPPSNNLPAPPQSGIPSTMGLGSANISPRKEQQSWQKVYVVESDIRNTTNKVEVIENRSVLGS